MAIVMRTPGAGGLGAVIGVLGEWQHDGATMQLHPGDLGWSCKLGVAATAAAVRTWSRGGELVAIGLLDSPTVLRLTVAPRLLRDEDLAERLVEDVSDPERGVLVGGAVAVEAPNGSLVQDRLGAQGWSDGERWTPLYRDLTAPVPDPGLRVRVVGADRAHERVALQRASFPRSRFTLEGWRAMAGGPAYADARCLVGEDERGTAVAAVTVWSAGVGRPGLLEPLGVHRAHRRHGHGRAISLAAAAQLRALGSSSAIVCTPSANVAAVATYASAGYVAQTERLDRSRPAG